MQIRSKSRRKGGSFGQFLREKRRNVGLTYPEGEEEKCTITSKGRNQRAEKGKGLFYAKKSLCKFPKKESLIVEKKHSQARE